MAIELSKLIRTLNPLTRDTLAEAAGLSQSRGQSSVELSKVSIAVNIVSAESYLGFHNAIMKGNPRTKEDALAIAKGLGIDTKKVEKALESKKSEIEAQIKTNQELASTIGINGTPAFVIGENLIPGALDTAALKERVATERKK